MTIRARVRAYGRRYRVDFGSNHEGWSVELDRILQQVERGTWEPPSSENGASAGFDAEETVHVTASRWWQRRKAELAPNTRLDYRWRLDHVLRHPAHPPAVRRQRQLAPLIADAYGLTERERVITEHVARGLATDDIAARELIAPSTVQDHLKSAFEKVRVRSRGELVARIFFDPDAPRLT